MEVFLSLLAWAVGIGGLIFLWRKGRSQELDIAFKKIIKNNPQETPTYFGYVILKSGEYEGYSDLGPAVIFTRKKSLLIEYLALGDRCGGIISGIESAIAEHSGNVPYKHFIKFVIDKDILYFTPVEPKLFCNHEQYVLEIHKEMVETVWTMSFG